MDPRPTCRVAGSACVPELGRVPRVSSPRSPPARLPAKATGLPTAAVHRPSSPTVRELWLIGDPPALHTLYMADLTPSAACVTVMSSLSRAHQAFAPPQQPDESALAVSGWDTQNCICLPTRSPGRVVFIRNIRAGPEITWIVVRNAGTCRARTFGRLRSPDRDALRFFEEQRP
jgi:hypothetical protein